MELFLARKGVEARFENDVWVLLLLWVHRRTSVERRDARVRKFGARGMVAAGLEFGCAGVGGRCFIPSM